MFEGELDDNFTGFGKPRHSGGWIKLFKGVDPPLPVPHIITLDVDTQTDPEGERRGIVETDGHSFKIGNPFWWFCGQKQWIPF